MLVLTSGDGLLFWPRSQVAMVRQEWHGRLEALFADGRLAHRPGPLSAVEGPPFVRLGPDTLVNPGLAAQRAGAVDLVDGWSVPGELGELPPAPPAPRDPLLPGTRIRASSILYLAARRGGAPVWVTARGERQADSRRELPQLAAQHPDLRPAGYEYFVNPRRMRRLARQEGQPVLEFDEGSTLRLTETALRSLLHALGLEDLDRVGGETQEQLHLRRLRVRRWPQRLFLAPQEFLRRHFFGSPERLIADMVMQTFDDLGVGESVPDGQDHRAYFYLPVRPTLQRAGHMVEAPVEIMLPRKFPADPLTEDEAWGLMCRVMTDMVKNRVVDYRSLGFRNRKPEYTLLGRTRPDVVVLVEKESLLDYARQLTEIEGVTSWISGGVPPLVGSEFLAQALQDAGVRTIIIVSYCDHDVVGYDMPGALSEQLDRFGVATSGIRRMITPDRFTPEEIRRLGVPIRTTGPPNYVARVERWMRETGGTLGEPLALHANALQPFDRVLEALRAVLA